MLDLDVSEEGFWDLVALAMDTMKFHDNGRVFSLPAKECEALLLEIAQKNWDKMPRRVRGRFVVRTDDGKETSAADAEIVR